MTLVLRRSGWPPLSPCLPWRWDNTAFRSNSRQGWRRRRMRCNRGIAPTRLRGQRTSRVVGRCKQTAGEKKEARAKLERELARKQEALEAAQNELEEKESLLAKTAGEQSKPAAPAQAAGDEREHGRRQSDARPGTPAGGQAQESALPTDTYFGLPLRGLQSGRTEHCQLAPRTTRHPLERHYGHEAGDDRGSRARPPPPGRMCCCQPQWLRGRRCPQQDGTGADGPRHRILEDEAHQPPGNSAQVVPLSACRHPLFFGCLGPLQPCVRRFRRTGGVRKAERKHPHIVNFTLAGVVMGELPREGASANIIALAAAPYGRGGDSPIARLYDPQGTRRRAPRGSRAGRPANRARPIRTRMARPGLVCGYSGRADNPRDQRPSDFGRDA